MIKQYIIAITLIFASMTATANSKKSYQTLKSNRTVVIAADGTATETTDLAYNILTEAGRTDLAFEKIQFPAAEASFELIEATSTFENSVTHVLRDEVKISAIPHQGSGLVDTKEAVIPLSNLKVGSEIKISYKITFKPIIGTIYSQGLVIANNELAKEEIYRFESAQPLKFYADHEARFYTIKQTEKNGRYLLEIKPTQLAYALEGKKVEVCWLLVSTAPSWKTLNELIAPSYLKEIKEPLPPAFQKIAQEAKKRTQAKDQIEYVSQELSKLVSYAGDWTTTNGKYFPQGHQKVLKNGKGDCKDYATSMAAILRQLNFTSYPALTFRSQSYLGIQKISDIKQIPNASMFNHAIVWAKDAQGKVWWVDPTNPLVIADVLTSDILGNYALVLDGTADKSEFLPLANQQTSDMTFEQTLSILPDNSISATGKVTMNPVSYNTIGMVERSMGSEGTKKAFSWLLNPQSKIDMNVVKDPTSMTNYSYSFQTADWIREEHGKHKALILFHPVGLMLSRMQPNQGGDLGDLGTFKIITHIPKQSQIDSVNASCIIRSRWLDVDRVVENKATEILVTDTVYTKNRSIEKLAASSDEFQDVFSSAYNCASNAMLVLYLNPSTKTMDMIEDDKLKGPPLETMTDADALALEELSGPKLFSYRAKKLYLYYSMKLAKNPDDSDALFHRAQALASLGYIKGDIYVIENLRLAVLELSKAIQTNKGPPHPRHYQLKIYYQLLMGQETEAFTAFQEMKTKLPNECETYASGFRIAMKRKDYKLAELWIKPSEKLAKTVTQQNIFHTQMIDLLEAQKKSKEAIPHREYFVNKDPKNPWILHNLAVTYASLLDYDKTIEIERRALDISDFGAARGNLTWALTEKALAMKAANKSRAPTSADWTLQKAEELLLEAVKWQPNDTRALTALANNYLDKYHLTKDTNNLTKGRPYLDRALKQNSDQTFTHTVHQIYKSFGY